LGTAEGVQTERVLVTGGGGFLGRFVVAQLRQQGYQDVPTVGKQDYDLRHREHATKLYTDNQPDVVVHLAATVGGIEANRQNPGKFFFENMAMGLHIIEEAKNYGRLKKLVIVGTTCSYPKFAATPFQEDDLWKGYPEETNAPYGVAKRAILTMAQAYREQYELNVIYLIPANLYGPEDNFDLTTGHVIPALIRKFVDAKEGSHPSVEVWGTGKVSREFLYVEDAAQGIVSAMLRYESKDPVNLGTGDEITIRELVDEIQQQVGYRGKVTWNTSMPDGQPRRRLDTRRAFREFGFRAGTSLRDGLKRTILWYQQTRRKVPSH
jgi:GDP-L-fucose synthase